VFTPYFQSMKCSKKPYFHNHLFTPMEKTIFPGWFLQLSIVPIPRVSARNWHLHGVSVQFLHAETPRYLGWPWWPWTQTRDVMGYVDGCRCLISSLKEVGQNISKHVPTEKLMENWSSSKNIKDTRYLQRAERYSFCSIQGENWWPMVPPCWHPHSVPCTKCRHPPRPGCPHGTKKDPGLR
jgi:hypothetical protein